MRLAVLMSRASPWSRASVLQLAEMGHEVHVVDFRDTSLGEAYLGVGDDCQAASVAALADRMAGVHLIESASRSAWRYLSSVPQLRRILKSCRPDLLLTLYGGGFGTMAFLSGFRPYAVYVVGSDVLLASGLRRWMVARSLNSADLVFANGAYLAEKTQELVTGPSVVPLLLGVDLSRWLPGPDESDTLGIVCTRGFLPIYNNAYLVEAAALLPPSLPDFSITFASKGPLLDEVRALAEQTLPPWVRDRVKFLGGVPDEELRRIVRQAHIYVSLSRSDGTSASLLEALACGLFPVLSDIPPNREWIDDSAGNGALVPLGRPELLARAIADAILNHGRRREAALHNRHLMEERADSRQTMRRMIGHLEALHARSPNAAQTHVH